MRTKEERIKNSNMRHALHCEEVNTNVANIKNELVYQQKVRAAYYLCSMVSIWVRQTNIPKDKLTMNAIKRYAWRKNARK